MDGSVPDGKEENKSRIGVSVAFLILAAGSLIDLNPYLSLAGIIFSIFAIALLLFYRDYFSRRQKRAVYSSIILYALFTIIVVAGFVSATLSIIQEIVGAGFSFILPQAQVSSLFSKVFPLLVLNAAASDGLCYYLLVMRLLHRVDHAIYIGALLVSVGLRLLVLVMTYNGTLPLPQQVLSYISLVRLDFYVPYQFLISVLGGLILGGLLLYVSIQISRGKVRRT